MHDNSTLWDEGSQLLHSREFDVAGHRFQFSLSDDYRAYTLRVTAPDGTIETVSRVSVEEVGRSKQELFEAYHANRLRRVQ
jgi:hypothetical protein